MSLDRYRRAVVTGASRGIGAAVVRQLCTSDIEVFAVARSAEDLLALADETGCQPLALDVGDRAAVLDALGGLEVDILVNNASATARAEPSWSALPDDIEALVDVNFKGTLNCLAAVVPGMKARGADYIGAEFDGQDLRYRLKFMRGSSVIWVDVDGRSGAIIGKAGE